MLRANNVKIRGLSVMHRKIVGKEISDDGRILTSWVGEDEISYCLQVNFFIAWGFVKQLVV